MHCMESGPHIDEEVAVSSISWTVAANCVQVKELFLDICSS
jgi:hypothetical protein